MSFRLSASSRKCSQVQRNWASAKPCCRVTDALAAENAIANATASELTTNASAYLDREATAAAAQAIAYSVPSLLSNLLRRRQPYTVSPRKPCALCLFHKLTGDHTLHHLDKCGLWEEPGLRCGNCGMLGHARNGRGGKRCQRKPWARPGDEHLAEGEGKDPYAPRAPAQPAPQPAQQMQQ